MPARTNRNEYLDGEPDSESDVPGYDSEEATAADSRTVGLGLHRAKRLKRTENAELSDNYDNNDDNDDDNHEIEDDRSPSPTQAPKEQLKSSKGSSPTTTKPPKNPPPSKKHSKPGILYLSRIPPYMPPSKVSHHLSPFGPITHIFLTPEPPSRRAHRLSASSTANKKRIYIDGWVEFKHRRHAKACAAAINGNVVGGKKGGWFRDDVWAVRYLKGFGWGDLMEGVRREEREREEKVRVGVGRDKREREAFLRGVEGARVEKGKEEKREKRRKGGSGGEGEGEKGGGKGDGEMVERRRFRQSDVLMKGDGRVEQSDEVKRVLSKIF